MIIWKNCQRNAFNGVHRILPNCTTLPSRLTFESHIAHFLYVFTQHDDISDFQLLLLNLVKLVFEFLWLFLYLWLTFYRIVVVALHCL